MAPTNRSNQDESRQNTKSAQSEHERRSEGAKKAMETRERNNPGELEEARRKGGEHSHGGGRSKEEDR